MTTMDVLTPSVTTDVMEMTMAMTTQDDDVSSKDLFHFNCALSHAVCAKVHKCGKIERPGMRHDVCGIRVAKIEDGKLSKEETPADCSQAALCPPIQLPHHSL